MLIEILPNLRKPAAVVDVVTVLRAAPKNHLIRLGRRHDFINLKLNLDGKQLVVDFFGPGLFVKDGMILDQLALR